MRPRNSLFARMVRNDDGLVDLKDRPRMVTSRSDQAYGAQPPLDTTSGGYISHAELPGAKVPAFDAPGANSARVPGTDEFSAISASL